jgi:release factor glutamine methyltransferase
VTEVELEKLRKMLARLGKGEPIQYVEGSVDFAGVSIQVDQRALIPRPETEELVEKVFHYLENKSSRQGLTCLDLCSGTGAIGIALKKRFPDVEVILSDISSDAARLAEENAKANGVFVTQLIGDLVEPLQKKVDIVVCNPPYIACSEYEQLDPMVKHFEPKQALCAGTTGLEFYERIARDVPRFLNKEAALFLEIGFQQGKDVKNIFENVFGPHVRLEQDLSGHDRFVLASID